MQNAAEPMLPSSRRQRQTLPIFAKIFEMLPMQTAFKEWAVVVDALIRGGQIVILRKGGIREGKAGFQLRANRFWLFPSQFHQQRESVVESAWQRFQADQSAFGCEKEVNIQAMVKIAQSWELADWSRIVRLDSQHIWRESVVKERFEWGRKKALFAWIVRVYRLERPISIPVIAKYGGCRSWIHLEPPMPSEEGLIPVLSDADFARQAARFRQTVCK